MQPNQQAKPGITPRSQATPETDTQSVGDLQKSVAELMALVAKQSQQIADMQAERAASLTPQSRQAIIDEVERRWQKHLAQADRGRHAYRVRIKGMKLPIEFRSDETETPRIISDYERKIGTHWIAGRMTLETVGATDGE